MRLSKHSPCEKPFSVQIQTNGNTPVPLISYAVTCPHFTVIDSRDRKGWGSLWQCARSSDFSRQEMVHLKLINTLWFPEGLSYATQEMFCSAPKTQLHLPRPMSAPRKARVTKRLQKSCGERVPHPPSASSSWAGWGCSGLFSKRISVASSEAEVLRVVRC